MMPSDSSGYYPTAEDVLRFLSENPDFLDKHASALKANAGDPDRLNIVDLTPAIAARARKEAQRLSKANESLLHVASENMVNWQRLHHATLALLASTDIAGMCEEVILLAVFEQGKSQVGLVRMMARKLRREINQTLDRMANKSEVVAEDPTLSFVLKK